MKSRIPSELVSGFDEMDVQHAAVLQALRSTEAAARAGDLAALRQAFAALSDQLVAHFDAEDRWMAGVGYPERSRHHAAHDMFLQDLAQTGSALASGLLAPVLEWLSERAPAWITFHIRVNDIPLGRYLSARARRAPGTGQASKPRLS